MRVKDVGVEDAERIVQQGVGDPGDVPDRILLVPEDVETVAVGRQPEGQGESGGHRQRGKTGQDRQQFEYRGLSGPFLRWHRGGIVTFQDEARSKPVTPAAGRS